MLFKFISTPDGTASEAPPSAESPTTNKAARQDLTHTLHSLSATFEKGTPASEILQALDTIVTQLTGVALGLSNPEIIRPNPNFKVNSNRCVFGYCATSHALKQFVTSEIKKSATKGDFNRGYRRGQAEYLTGRQENKATPLPFKNCKTSDAEIESLLYQEFLKPYQAPPSLKPKDVSKTIKNTLGFHSLTRPLSKSPKNWALFNGYVSAVTLQRMTQAIPAALRWELFQQSEGKNSLKVLMLKKREVNQGPPAQEWLTVIDKPQFLARLQRLKDTPVASDAGEQAKAFVLNRLLWLTSLSVWEIIKAQQG